jgi:non-ribosomal peptide synthetase component F
MIGLFINTLPLRVQFSSTDEILSVFHRIQKQMSQLQRYSYVPLGKIKSWSEISGTKSLFDSIIVFENYPVDENKPISDLYIKSIPGGFQKTEFPLTIGVLPHEQLSFYFGYEVTYFTKENIEYLAESLKKILRKIAKLGYNKK